MTIEATMGDRRRLAACLVLAAALHVVVILAVKVPEPPLRNPLPPIAVVLQQGFTPDPPRQEANVEPDRRFDAPAATPTVPEEVGPEAELPEESPHPSTETLPKTRYEAASGHPEGEPANATVHDLAGAITAEAQRLETAALHGSGADDGESLRVRRLTGPPAGDPELAYYLDSWRRKVERVGNINYPSEARARGLSGTLQLLVVIDPDGALKDVQVLASSGHPLLDDGAVRIVHLAAPFSPFTASMRARIDLLEIERTWRFRKDRLTPVP